jgi:hypothetical protein
MAMQLHELTLEAPRMKYPQWALVLAVMASMAACNPQPAARPTPTQIAAVPAAPTTRPASPTPSRTASLPEHRIGVRVVNGVGEFYDRISGEKFVPRGNNFIRLAPQRTEDGSTQVYHSVFDPGRYDSVEIAGHMGHMRYAGYNMVRVFVSQNTIGSPAGGLSEEYMHNVADFLRLAK